MGGESGGGVWGGFKPAASKKEKSVLKKAEYNLRRNEWAQDPTLKGL